MSGSKNEYGRCACNTVEHRCENAVLRAEVKEQSDRADGYESKWLSADSWALEFKRECDEVSAYLDELERDGGDAPHRALTLVARVKVQVEELTRERDTPKAEEIIAAIERFAERKEADFDYQRERANQAEAKLARVVEILRNPDFGVGRFGTREWVEAALAAARKSEEGR
jgi:hypothetical protein